MKNEKWTYHTGTVGLMCNHKSFNKTRMVRAEVYRDDANTMRKLLAVNGHNCNPIDSIPAEIYTAEKWAEIVEYDQLDDIVFASFCFEQLGLSL
jgi:hypothetical protein